MKSMPSLADIRAQLQALMPELRREYRVQELEIFGSYVHGREDETSDLDLLVTFSVPPTLFQFIELENFLSDSLGLKVDLVMKTSLRPVIGERILAEAQPL